MKCNKQKLGKLSKILHKESENYIQLGLLMKELEMSMNHYSNTKTFEEWRELVMCNLRKFLEEQIKKLNEIKF